MRRWMAAVAVLKAMTLAIARRVHGFVCTPAAAMGLLVLAFVLAYGPTPLFYSNQYLHLAHTLASQRVGFLADDWLARTQDAMPVFTLVSGFLYGLLGSSAFYLLWGALIAVYAASLFSICLSVFPSFDSPARKAVLFFALMAAHSLPVRALFHVSPAALEYYNGLWGGLARQELACSYYQPSLYGVFILTSIACFLRGRLVIAFLLPALATTFHATYLLSALYVLGAYMAAMAVERLRLTAFRGAPSVAKMGSMESRLQAECR
ncbi:MAG: hypothetical protein NTW86_16300, partial [Candidatus Sumerlaeota bacterium]|nr:hypothetical protein [Candidatus Sumerlaeota bacterium]